MAKISLDKLSLEDLKALRKDVDKAIAGFAEKKRQEAKKALEDVAAKHGMSLDEILGATQKRKKAKAAAKYRNPANPDETWSGRGRQPGWYKEAIAKGQKPENMVM